MRPSFWTSARAILVIRSEGMDDRSAGSERDIQRSVWAEAHEPQSAGAEERDERAALLSSTLTLATASSSMVATPEAPPRQNPSASRPGTHFPTITFVPSWKAARTDPSGKRGGAADLARLGVVPQAHVVAGPADAERRVIRAGRCVLLIDVAEPRAEGGRSRCSRWLGCRWRGYRPSAVP